MTVDWNDLADGLRCLLLPAGLGWAAYAWLRRVEYRRAVLVLVGIVLLDWLAHQFAAFASRPDSGLPTDFSVYSVIVLLAALLGLAVSAWYARRVGLSLATVLDAGLVVVISGGIGARLYHLLANLDYYSQNADDVLNLAQGGMALRGGLILGAIALLLWARLRRLSFWPLADAAALGLALAQSIGWYGAALVGANYGLVSDSPLAQDLPDVYGIVAPRLPVQWFASLFFLFLFLVLLWIAWRGAAPGRLFVVYLLVSALGGFGLGFLRADETLLWNGWRIDQWVDLALAALGLLLVAARYAALGTRARREAR